MHEQDITPAPPLLASDFNIALSFSGGGFRAAAFTLGCSSYLYHAVYDGRPLLHRVKFISSASGGSITNLVLSSMLRQGRTFDDAYRHLLCAMKGTNLMDKVFKVLNDDAQWKHRPRKTRNLINAFAMVYDSDLFDGADLGTLSRRPFPDTFVIQEVCVNTTDFDNGLNFRFGTEGLIGNTYLHIKDKTVAGKIKLADILACSSCFPAGFEPVMFPMDFTWKQNGEELTEQELVAAVRQLNHYNEKETPAAGEGGYITFGLMDGGIDDNQGIYAFMRSDSRKKAFGYDLYFPCDVSSNYLSKPFVYPGKNSNAALTPSISQWRQSVKKKVSAYFATCGIVCAGSIALAASGIATPVFAALAGAALASAAVPVAAYMLAKKQLKKILGDHPAEDGNSKPGTWKIIFNKYKHHFTNIPLSQLLQMAEARLMSVLLLADTVYLKKIRRASYELLFSTKSNDVYRQLINAHNNAPVAAPIDAGRLWNDRVALTTVYLLAAKNDHQLQQQLKIFSEVRVSDTDARTVRDLLQPSEALRQVVNTATDMDTTLWFDHHHSNANTLEALVAAGRATMCFNLIRMSYRFGNSDAAWMNLRSQLIADWERFNADPFWQVS